MEVEKPSRLELTARYEGFPGVELMTPEGRIDLSVGECRWLALRLMELAEHSLAASFLRRHLTRGGSPSDSSVIAEQILTFAAFRDVGLLDEGD